MDEKLKVWDYVLELIGKDIEDNGIKTNTLRLKSLAAVQNQIDSIIRLSNGGNSRARGDHNDWKRKLWTIISTSWERIAK